MYLLTKKEFEILLVSNPKQKFVFYDVNKDGDPYGEMCITSGNREHPVFGAINLSWDNIDNIEYNNWKLGEFDWNLAEYPDNSYFYVFGDGEVMTIIDALMATINGRTGE